MTPNAIQKVYASTFVSSLDMMKPQVLNTLFKKYGSQGLAYLMVRSLGFERPVAGDLYSHFEEDMYHDSIKQEASTAVADPGAGNDITLTLDATKLSSENEYYVRRNDVVTFKNEAQGWVETITVTTGGLGGGVDKVDLLVRPFDLTSTLGAVAAGEELAITSNVWPEGSGFPEALASGYEKYENEAQIIKEHIGATGTQLVTETYIDYFNEAGEYQGVYRAGQAQLDYRILEKIDGAFFLGRRIDNTGNRAVNTKDSKYPKKGTEGLIPFLRRKGNVNPYTVGAYSVDEFDSYDLTLEKNFVPTDIPLWFPQAINLYQEVENELVTYLADTNIQYARQAVNDMLFKSDESLGVSLNFKYLQKSGRTYLFHKLSGFSNSKTYGISSYDFQKMGFIIPVEKRKDPKTKDDIPSMGIRYRAMGAYNRRMITDTLKGIGANGGSIPVNEIDETNTFQMAHLGAEFFGGNRMILVDPS